MSEHQTSPPKERFRDYDTLTEELIEERYREEKKKAGTTVMAIFVAGLIYTLYSFIAHPQIDIENIETRIVSPVLPELYDDDSWGKGSGKLDIMLYDGNERWSILRSLMHPGYDTRYVYDRLHDADTCRIWAERGGSTVVGISAPGVEIPMDQGLASINQDRRARYGMVLLAALIFPYYFWADLRRAFRRRKLARMRRADHA